MRKSLLACLFVIGCVDADKGPESAVPDLDDKADSFASPTDHGAIGWDQMVTASLTAAAGYHTWTFDLSGDAEVDVFTGPPYAHAHAVDTVLYLYKQQPSGRWGSYIARNDDIPGHKWSSIDKHLGAGHYRALVKGYDASTRGKFGVTAHCDGAGCAPEMTCLFGSTYHDAQASMVLNPWVNQLHATDAMSDLTKQQIVLALRDTGWTDVATVEEAFSHVQDGVINWGHYYDFTAATSWVSFEYGSGDNSYGAIFEARSTTMVAQIHDGDLYSCTAVAQECVLGQNLGDLLANPDFTADATRNITAASQVTGVEAQELLTAVHEAWADAPDVATAIADVQDATVYETTMHHRGDGVAVTVFKFYAGDNAYGMIFYAGTMTTAAAINDLDFYGCTYDK